jgi:hypothetical protein
VSDCLMKALFRPLFETGSKGWACYIELAFLGCKSAINRGVYMLECKVAMSCMHVIV